MQHKSCKNIDITNPETIFPWVFDCIKRHIKRYDFRRLLITHGMPKETYDKMVYPVVNGMIDTRAEKDYYLMKEYVMNIAIDCAERIKTRNLILKPVRIRERCDRTTDKVRYIGEEEAMQQCFDFIAVYSCADVWRRRIVPQQVSSIKGRGQIKGVKAITKWIKSDNRYIRYCKAHGLRYTSKVKCYGKEDIRKCYPSGRVEVFLPLLKKDVKNDDIIWLWEVLLLSHRVIIEGTDIKYMGFMIGALPSQWAMQYMISFIYRYVMSLKNSRGKTIVSHAMIFLDDILLTASNRKQLKRAIISMVRFAKDFLQLEIKPTWHIKYLDDCGIDMMGYVIYRSGKIAIRGRDFIKNRRMALRFKARNGNITIEQARRICSKKGEYIHSNSAGVVQEYGLKEIFATAEAMVSRYDKEHRYVISNVQSTT